MWVPTEIVELIVSYIPLDCIGRYTNRLIRRLIARREEERYRSLCLTYSSNTKYLYEDTSSDDILIMLKRYAYFPSIRSGYVIRRLAHLGKINILRNLPKAKYMKLPGCTDTNLSDPIFREYQFCIDLCCCIPPNTKIVDWCILYFSLNRDYFLSLLAREGLNKDSIVDVWTYPSEEDILNEIP
jgi:hypothetical protein